MSRLSDFDFRQKFTSEELDYVALCSALSDYQAPRQKINELLKAGVILRVKKGLYVFAPKYRMAPVCGEVLANLIYGPSCLSLEYALSYHGLIPERVVQFTSITLKRNRRFDTPLGRFVYERMPAEVYATGIEWTRVDKRHSFLLACPEKALCDYVLLRKVGPLRDGQEAGEFLENDLRLDISRIDASRLERLSRVYRDESIQCLLKAL